MAVRAYSPVLPSVEVFGAYEGIASATGVNQKVSLTFTPTTGNLTIVPYDGDDNISQLQLEVGSTPSSYIPTLVSSTVTRAADTLTIPSANLPWPTEAPLAVSIQMEGRMTYVDDGVGDVASLVNWQADINNWILLDIRDDIGSGQLRVFQRSSGVIDQVRGDQDAYSPGILVPFNIASRHGSTFVNGAVDGTTLTADTTPTALPDLSATNMQIGSNFMGTIKTLRVWAEDIGDVGIASAST